MSDTQSVVPSVFLLVPGPWEDEAALGHALGTATLPLGTFDDGPIAANHVRFGLVQDPGGFGNALSWSRDGQNEEMVRAANACTAAALIEIGATLDRAVATLGTVSQALRSAGGVGIRIESSGASVDWATWFSALDDETLFGLVHHTTLLVADGKTTYTTGMHAFQQPDALVEGHDPDLVSGLSAVQVVDKPRLMTGHTYSPGADQPRWTLQRWPDYRFTPDDGRHNPFGFWRLTPPGVAGPGVSDPLPVILPPLTTILFAAEREHERPLTQDEVVALVDNAAAIEMSAADALLIERARGYADIEPSLAWQQWQIVRSMA